MTWQNLTNETQKSQLVGFLIIIVELRKNLVTDGLDSDNYSGHDLNDLISLLIEQPSENYR